jgi:hypothetical protein
MAVGAWSPRACGGHFVKRLAPLKASLRVSVFEKSLIRRDVGI